jgi:hypothetical protein
LGGPGTGAVNPSAAALDANFSAIQTGIRNDDQRIRRGVVATTATTTAVRHPNFRSTIRSIEIKGRRIQVPDNGAPANPR